MLKSVEQISNRNHFKFPSRKGSHLVRLFLCVDKEERILTENYFLPNCSLSPSAATAEAIPLMAVLNLLREGRLDREGEKIVFQGQVNILKLLL